MQLTKHIGCLLALVFATASAFANDTWFTAEIGDSLVSPWSGSLSALTIDNGVIKLNNWNGTDELVYTPGVQKTLPGDVATVKTSVKFTAMDKADFDDPQHSTIATDAKAGLTIVENSDVTPVEQNFYVIFGGNWVKVDNTDQISAALNAALSGDVPVEVSFSKDKAVKAVSYKVNGVEIVSGETAFDGDTIASVSYKGVCEISELEGIAAKSVFELTVPTIANAEDAVVKVGGQVVTPKTEGGSVYSITSGVGAVEISYATPSGYMGSVTTKTYPAGLEGTTVLEAKDFESSIKKIIAKIGANEYPSVEDALKAGTEIEIIADPMEATGTAESSIEIAKTGVKFSADDTVIINSNISIDEGFDLTIVGGRYKGTFTNNGQLKLSGPAYFLYLPTTEEIDAQDLCADGFFARAMTGDYLYQVVEGTVIEPTTDVPAIAVDPAAIPQEKTPAAYLAEPVAEGSTMKRWESYALGLGTEPTVVPEITAVAASKDKDDEKIDLTANFKPLTQTGLDYKIMISKDNGEAAAADAINLTDVTGVHKFTVSVSLVDKNKETKSSGLAQSVIGANKVALEEGARTLVTVPWTADKAGVAVTIEELFKNANVANGDKVEVYDTANDAYFTWTRVSGSWAPGANIAVLGKDDIEIPAAAAYTVARGQAVWFTSAAGGSIYQVGTADAAAGTTTIAAGNHWGHIANPVSGTAKTLGQLMATAPAKATVELVDDQGKTRLYSYDSTNGWGYEDYTETEKTVRGKKTKVATKTHVQSDPSIAPGKAFWLMNEDATDSTTIKW